MSDIINGVPIIGEPVPKNALAIAQVAIELPPGSPVFEVKLIERAVVRAVGFWICEPKVLASAMRGMQKVLMPLLWVECDPTAKIDPVARVFAFVPSDRPFSPKPGWQARYIATATHERGAMHLLELVEAPSSPRCRRDLPAIPGRTPIRCALALGHEGECE